MLEFLKKHWWCILLGGFIGWCLKSGSTVQPTREQEEQLEPWITIFFSLSFVIMVIAFILFLIWAFREIIRDITWTCTCGKRHRNAEKFCSLCGGKKTTGPVPVLEPTIAPTTIPDSEWICMGCGEKNGNVKKFCTKCGKQRP